MVEYLTIFPYLSIDGRRDICFLPPEVELAAIGFVNGYFCKTLGDDVVAERGGRQVGYAHLLDAGLVAVCRLFDEAEDLNAAMLTDFETGGRQVIRGANRDELLCATNKRIGQVIEDAALVVQRAAFEQDVDAALASIIAGLEVPGDWAGFGAWQLWAMSVLSSPESGNCYPPGIFVDKSQSFGERGLQMVETHAQVTARKVEHPQVIILAVVELFMLLRTRVALENWVSDDY